MLQSPKNGKNRNEKRRLKRNNLNNNELRTLLKTCVFSTNFAFGCFHASFERHFVKKIQHYFSFDAAYTQFLLCCFLKGFFCCRNVVLKAGSINYHRNIIIKFYEIRFVIFWLLFGSKCKFVQSCSSLHSFTLLHFDLKNKLKI